MARLVFSAADGDIAAPDLALAKRAFDVLDRHYPGHPWGVNASHAGGILTVALLYPNAIGVVEPWGVIVKLADLATDPALNDVMRAGGELLERWRLRRGAAGVDSRHFAKANGIDAIGAATAKRSLLH